MTNKIEAACEWAVGIANDNSHGYDQINRWGPNYDCSSLVISAWDQTGIPVKAAGATYTGNMKKAFEKCGFKIIPYVKGMTLIRGDVVVCDHYSSNNKYYGHTLIYLGNGKIVQASINEKGTTKGGASGDQTGREISVGNFYEYSHGWDFVARYEYVEVQTVNVEMQVLKQGDTGEQVKTLQRLLKELGYKGKPVNGTQKVLTIDGDFGTNTAYAVGTLQGVMKNKGIIQNVDYIVGNYTWNYLLKGNK